VQQNSTKNSFNTERTEEEVKELEEGGFSYSSLLSTLRRMGKQVFMWVIDYRKSHPIPLGEAGVKKIDRADKCECERGGWRCAASPKDAKGMQRWPMVIFN
jgi:hypothetical protein